MPMTESLHPLASTAAQYVWLLPALPLLGFLINGGLAFAAAAKPGPADPSAADHNAHGHGDHAHDAHGHDDHGHGDHGHPPRHKFAAITSLVGPGVMVVAFGLALAIFFAMRGVAMEHAYVNSLFS